MLNEESLIKDFFELTYEAYINEQMLEYEYSFPEEEIEDYVLAIISIPYKKFIDYVCEHYCSTPITSASIPQISNYDNCTTGVIRVLINNDDPGLECKAIGKELFNDNVERNIGAYTKYGENHVKGAEFHGLTYCLYKKWFLTCLGRIYPSFDEEIKQSLFARTLLRNPFFHIVVSEAINKDVNIYNFMGDLSHATRQRRSSSCIQFFNIITKQCKLENVHIHKIYYEAPIKVRPNIPIINKKLISAPITKTSLSNNYYFISSNDDLLQCKSLSIFIKELSLSCVYSRDEQNDLFNLYHNGEHKAFDLIVKNNLRLVLYYAYRQKNKGISLEDLIQEGCFGLFYAIEKFNYSKNINFTHYAGFGIKNAIDLAFKRLGNVLLISSKMQSVHSQMHNIIERYELENGYKPSLSDIVIYIDDEKIDDNDLMCLYELPSNLNDMVTYLDDWDSFEDDTFLVGKNLELEDKHTIVRWILSCINERERDILKLHYGIDCGREYSLEEIGEMNDLTRERVRQIKEKALRKLKGKFLKKKYSDLYDVASRSKEENTRTNQTDNSSATETPKSKKLEHNTPSEESTNLKIHNKNESIIHKPTRTIQYYLLTTELNRAFIENGLKFPSRFSKQIQSITGIKSNMNETFNVKIEINGRSFYTQMRHLCFSNSNQNFFMFDWKVQGHIQEYYRELKKRHDFTHVEIYGSNGIEAFIIKPIYKSQPTRNIEKDSEELKILPNRREEKPQATPLLRIMDYSQRAIVVYGDTRPFADIFKEHGGTFNPHLRDGAGWVFSKNRETEIRTLVDELIKQHPSKQYELGFNSNKEEENSTINNELSNVKIELKQSDGKVEILAPYEALKQVLLQVGPQKVFSLDIRISGLPIMLRRKPNDATYEEIAINWWLNTNLKADHYFNSINIILNHFNVGIKVKLV